MLARRFGLARGFDVYDDELAAGRRGAHVARDDRSGAGLSSAAPSTQPRLPLGALLRSARAVRAAGAVPHAIRGKRRTSARSRRWTSSSAGSSQAFEQRGRRAAAGDRRRRRSRRRARRSRRVAARQPALSVDDARAAGAGRAGVAPRRRATRRSARAASFTPILDWAGLGCAPTACAAPAPGSRARRGDEAVPRVRLAAAGHGGRGRRARRSSRARSRSTTSRPIRRRHATLVPAPTLPPALRDGAATTIRCRRRRRARAPDSARRRGARRSSPASATSAPARAPVVRKDAPRPADMTASVRRRRAGVGPVRRRAIRGGDPAARADPRRAIRTTSTPRCAWRPRTRRSGRTRRPLAAFKRAAATRAALAGRPDSTSRCTTRAARTGRARCRCSSRSSPRRPSGCRRSRRWRRPRAAGAAADAIALRQKIYALRAPAPAELRAARPAGDGARSRRALAIAAFETRARRQGAAFTHDLELGVLYLAARRFAEARAALDRVPAVTSRLPDGALQARAGQRAAERARPRRADRGARASGGRDDAPADREENAVSGSEQPEAALDTELRTESSGDTRLRLTHESP